MNSVTFLYFVFVYLRIKNLVRFCYMKEHGIALPSNSSIFKFPSKYLQVSRLFSIFAAN